MSSGILAQLSSTSKVHAPPPSRSAIAPSPSLLAVIIGAARRETREYPPFPIWGPGESGTHLPDAGLVEDWAPVLSGTRALTNRFRLFGRPMPLAAESVGYYVGPNPSPPNSLVRNQTTS